SRPDGRWAILPGGGADGRPGSGPLPQRAEEVGDVPGGVDAVVGAEDDAVLVEDDRRAQRTLAALAGDLALAPGAPRTGRPGLGVGEQGERQRVGLCEVRERLRGVGGDADDPVPAVRERGLAVAEIAGLGGASGREGLRVEVDDGAAAAEVVEGDAASVGGREVEVGGVVARGQLLGHRCPLVSGACAQACRLASATAQALVTAIVTTIQAGSRGGFADLSGRTKSGSQVIAAAAVCTDVDGWSEVVMAASGVLVSGWGARWVRLSV